MDYDIVLLKKLPSENVYNFVRDILYYICICFIRY